MFPISEYLNDNISYLVGVIGTLLIGLVWYYTIKKIYRAKAQHGRSRNIYKNALMSVFRAQRDGALYSLLEKDSGENGENEEEENEDEIVSLTHALVIWTGVLATATIIAVGVAWLTLSAIRGQLDEMQTTTEIQKTELAAEISDQISGIPQGPWWIIGVQLVNTGKTDAVDLSAWNIIHIFRNPRGLTYRDLRGYNFVDAPDKGKWAYRKTALIPNNPPAIFETYPLTAQDGWDAIYNKAFPAEWGYVEYKDIFGTYYTLRWCVHFSFTRIGKNIAMNLPGILLPECQVRTRSPPKQRQ